jgi:hypothetical protein
VHEHQLSRRLRDARTGAELLGAAGFTRAVLGLRHGDLAHRAADQHRHNDKQQPAPDSG